METGSPRPARMQDGNGSREEAAAGDAIGARGARWLPGTKSHQTNERNRWVDLSIWVNWMTADGCMVTHMLGLKLHAITYARPTQATCTCTINHRYYSPVTKYLWYNVPLPSPLVPYQVEASGSLPTRLTRNVGYGLSCRPPLPGKPTVPLQPFALRPTPERSAGSRGGLSVRPSFCVTAAWSVRPTCACATSVGRGYGR